MSSRIIVAEDDPHIASLVATYLQRDGHEISVARDGEQALELSRRVHPSAVLLDLMLPKVDGWEVCRQLRACSDVPILMLTARGEEADRLLGFALGSDDYVVKPFSPRELVQRVRAILRRYHAQAAPHALLQAPPLTVDGLLVDLARCEATVDGRRIDLTATEFQLLHVLAQRPGLVFSRTALLDHVNRRGEVVVERSIDVHIGNLRRKLGDSSRTPRFIETVRGHGYRLADSRGTTV